MTAKAPHLLIGRLVDIQHMLGLSGSEMARRLQINPSSWTRLVTGEMQPSLRIVQAVVVAFPELRSFCVELLLIRSTDTADSHIIDPVEVAS